MKEISVINSFHHCQFPSSKVSIVKDESDVSQECKKPKIDLNMPVKNIPIEVVDEIEDNYIQTVINESQPDEPSPEVQDFTIQNVDPKDPELLITGFIAAPPVQFYPLNFVQRKRISTEVFKLGFDINQPEVQYIKCGSTLNEKSSHLVKMAGDGHCFFCSISFLLTATSISITKFPNSFVTSLRVKIIWEIWELFWGTAKWGNRPGLLKWRWYHLHSLQAKT